MKIVLGKSGAAAPRGFVRVALSNDTKDLRRIVRDNGIDTLHIGTEKPSEMNARKFIILCRTIVRCAKAQHIKKLSIDFSATPELFKNTGLSQTRMAEIAAENFELADYEFNRLKSKPSEGWDCVEEVYYCGKGAQIANALRRGSEIGRAVNACRDLANTPGGDMTPTVLAQSAKSASKGLPISVKTLGRKEMEKLGMGAILGVANGSAEEPTFTIVEYKGSTEAPIVLVGKGVTFDSGGLNLKPSSSIYEMHMDMSGAAAALYTVVLASRLKLKKHLIALMPAVENMPGQGAYRPGDVLKSLSGKTIEVLDTDAEGRIILADAITYAKRLKPSVVIDMATLTGAAISALGLYASAVLSRDDKLAQQIVDSGEVSGDYAWRLPLWDEYESRVKGTFGDFKNVPGGATSRYGGAIDGAMFLWQFAKELDCPWAHIDIAPRMTSAPGDELAEGAAGAPLRLLIHYIENAV